MRIEPAERIAGSLRPPPDKSISHRAALVAAMCEGATRVRNYLRAADTASTLAAVRALGAAVEELADDGSGGDLLIQGVGLRGASEADRLIDVGNAGTLLRLLPGWLAGQGHGRWTLDGDESIRRRPVDRVAEPLRRMGAGVECRDGRLPPLVVDGAELEGITHELPVASAQVKSCVLLAGLLAAGDTTVVERVRTRNHTELMLRRAGVHVAVESRGPTDSGAVTVGPVEHLALGELTVPGDFSSAAFFIVAATLVSGSELVLDRVGVNPTRTGLLSIMKRMGATVEVTDEREDSGEPVADLHVSSASLNATVVEAHEVPLAIDELPLVALLGAFAKGVTEVRGAGELRHKESDRIATVVTGLRALGVGADATEDGFVIEGAGALRGGTIDAVGDHRLAMLGGVAGLASQQGVEVQGFEAATVSYPGFLADLEAVRR
jgi:3-phosphoshikimate 1-carboxyvinyltransferase